MVEKGPHQLTTGACEAVDQIVKALKMLIRVVSTAAGRALGKAAFLVEVFAELPTDAFVSLAGA